MTRRAPRRYYKQNRLQQLRGFCYAAQSGSMSKAAQYMLLSQPSVSLQIQALEREFKATLFERHGRGLRLTPDGEVLLALSAPLVDAMDMLPSNFDAKRAQVDIGELDIAAGESTILYLLPRFVKDFADRCPRVELKLHNVTGPTGLRMLRSGEVDIAVGSMIDVPEDILYVPLFTYDPMLITALDHPLAKMSRLTLKAVSAHPLILPPRQLTTWRLVDAAFRQRDLAYSVRVEVGGWEVIKRYVALGLGVSVVTSICLTGDEAIHAIPVNRYFPRRTYGIVLKKGRLLSPQAKRFIHTIAPTDKVPEDLA